MSKKASFANGFSLVELLVVLAIIAIAGAIIIPSIAGLVPAYQLSATSQVLINQIMLARQNALSSSHGVQVRIYYLPDFNAMTPQSAPLAAYRGLQSFAENSPTVSGISVTPLAKPLFFPSPVIISKSITVSPLTGTSLQAPAAGDPLLPSYGMNYKYLVFRFRPDGSTDLSTGSNSFTLVLENQKLVANGLPADFLTLEIDPVMGGVRSFRP